jgi:hypothetical protein
MKKLLPFLLVIVYLNNGKVFKYPNADTVECLQGTLIVEKINYDFRNQYLAEFSLYAVERWEVK